MGHQERFPPTRLSAGCGFRKETIAGMRRNGRVAPIPDLPTLAAEGDFYPWQSLVEATSTATHSRPSRCSNGTPPGVDIYNFWRYGNLLKVMILTGRLTIRQSLLRS